MQNNFSFHANRAFFGILIHSSNWKVWHLRLHSRLVLLVGPCLRPIWIEFKNHSQCRKYYHITIKVTRLSCYVVSKNLLCILFLTLYFHFFIFCRLFFAILICFWNLRILLHLHPSRSTLHFLKSYLCSAIVCFVCLAFCLCMNCYAHILNFKNIEMML
jgi:hypothetical protein